MAISQTPPTKSITTYVCAEEEPLLNIMSALFGVLDHEEFEVLPDEAKLHCIEYVRDIAALRVSLPKVKSDAWARRADDTIDEEVGK